MDVFKRLASYLVLLIGCSAVLATLFLTLIFGAAFLDFATRGYIDGWAGLGFAIVLFYIAPSTLAFGVIPSGILYYFTQHRRDLLSLCLNGGSFLTAVIEAIIVFGLPHGSGC
jgi:hypothetical protein